VGSIQSVLLYVQPTAFTEMYNVTITAIGAGTGGAVAPQQNYWAAASTSSSTNFSVT